MSATLLLPVVPVVPVTPAHEQTQRITLRWTYPAHDARDHDPHAAAFRTARARLVSQGLLRCVVCGAEDQVELHHSHVEYALQGGIDVGKLNQALGLHLTDAEFAAWIDSPGNLEPLCLTHHRGAEGVHLLPSPAWEVLRYWRDGLALVEAIVGAVA